MFEIVTACPYLLQGPPYRRDAVVFLDVSRNERIALVHTAFKALHHLHSTFHIRDQTGSKVDGRTSNEVSRSNLIRADGAVTDVDNQVNFPGLDFVKYCAFSIFRFGSWTSVGQSRRLPCAFCSTLLFQAFRTTCTCPSRRLSSKIPQTPGSFHPSR